MRLIRAHRHVGHEGEIEHNLASRRREGDRRANATSGDAPMPKRPGVPVLHVLELGQERRDGSPPRSSRRRRTRRRRERARCASCSSAFHQHQANAGQDRRRALPCPRLQGRRRDHLIDRVFAGRGPEAPGTGSPRRRRRSRSRRPRYGVTSIPAIVVRSINHICYFSRRTGVLADFSTRHWTEPGLLGTSRNGAGSGPANHALALRAPTGARRSKQRCPRCCATRARLVEGRSRRSCACPPGETIPGLAGRRTVAVPRCGWSASRISGLRRAWPSG